MLNDFRNKDFKVVNKLNKLEYYVQLNGKWYEVRKEIYNFYKREYQKMYRDYHKDKNRCLHYEDLDNSIKFSIDNTDITSIDIVYEKQLKQHLYNALNMLNAEEQYIIIAIYFYDQSERALANELNISQPTLHYKKTKILKKLKNFLIEMDLNVHL